MLASIPGSWPEATPPAGRAAAPRTTTVAGYLLTRLTQAGVISVFGVPGDYNLGILDVIASRASLAWVGMASEQGAGYAASSYARLRGVGTLVTTFGVGELSAMNAIAGAYAESVPVVHIVGTPALAARRAGAMSHHNLPRADFGHFARMAAEVTVAQADLRADSAPAEIDRVLRAALRTSRPVYLAIPADVADAPVACPSGQLLAAEEGHAGPAALAAFGRHARRVLGAAASADVQPAAAAPADQAAPLTLQRLWSAVQEFLLPDDLVIVDQGTAFYGAAGLILPAGARLVTRPQRASIGWAMPAALGASLAATDRRVVVIVGDSAIQQTAPELGTMLAQGLAPVVIVLDNEGYTVESVIRHPSADYHQIPGRDWTKLPATGTKDIPVVARRATTGRELAAALLEVGGAGLPVLIEAVLGPAGAPPQLQDLASVLAASDRPPASVRRRGRAGFVSAFAALRGLQLLLYARARHHLPATRPLYNVYPICFGAGGALWLSSLAVAPPGRYAFWAAALITLAAFMGLVFMGAIIRPVYLVPALTVVALGLATEARQRASALNDTASAALYTPLSGT